MIEFHLLVVDDDPQIRKLLERALHRAGYAVEVAENGRAALAQMADTTFDLIVTDLVMPEFDGLQLIDAVRQRCPAAPIIAITGGGNTHLADLARMNDVAEVLLKPFTSQALIAAVARHLPGRRNAAIDVARPPPQSSRILESWMCADEQPLF